MITYLPCRGRGTGRKTTYTGGWYGMGRVGWGEVGRYADTRLLDTLPVAMQRE